MEMKKLNVVAILAMACATLPMYATTQETPAAQTTTDAAAGAHSWPVDQLVTLSVREAWALGGKTEQGFFDIVKQLTEVAAQKRAITLPDNKQAGVKAGDWIKKQAKKDPDQLLYVIVDRAVQYSARVTTAQ